MYSIHPTFLHYFEQVIRMEISSIKFNQCADEATVQMCLDQLVSKKFITADIIAEDQDGTFLVELNINSDNFDSKSDAGN